jgi:hypothetical protein
MRRLSLRRILRRASFAYALSATFALQLTERARPTIAFERITENPYYVYLIFALSSFRTIRCSLRDAYRIWNWLPPKLFLAVIRVGRPSRAVIISETRKGPGIITINPDYYSSPSKDALVVPYFAHPEFYKQGLHLAAPNMRRHERTTRIFFAGSHSAEYSENFAFPLLTRDAILDHLIKRGGTNIRIVSGRPLTMISYLEEMSRSAFAVCPPGMIIPHAHNLIEAMAVGTIPITNYHVFTRPPLMPDKHCLAFSTIEQLDQVIERALSMTAAATATLRDDVIAHYDAHLAPASFGKKFEQIASTLSELVVNDEWRLWDEAILPPLS